jgi:antirestriction protein
MVLLIRVYITNLAKYNEGILKGTWFTLPAELEELDEVISEVLGNNEEYFISDYESELKIEVPEYVNLHQLNETLKELEKVPEDDRKVICLIASYEGLELSEVIQEYHEGKYTVFNASNFEELGEYLAEEGLLGYEIPEHLKDYIDFSALGQDWLYSGNYIDLSDEGYYVTY